ncbi:hypothetical protein K2Y11_10465, partial [bacterium]|nr:hypothetical protein [bacterium]
AVLGFVAGVENDLVAGGCTAPTCWTAASVLGVFAATVAFGAVLVVLATSAAAGFWLHENILQVPQLEQQPFAKREDATATRGRTSRITGSPFRGEKFPGPRLMACGQ